MSAEALVEVDSGRLGGRAREGVHEFLGVPFATAPRFAPPGTVEQWVGVRAASEIGPAAPQPLRAVAVFTHGEPPAMSEPECLNLNVFTPDLDGSLPVVVWLHGGGFAIGFAGSSIYDGGALARAAGVVVVTVNYRLGDLGWLWHPELAAGPGEPAGNWGLLDQIAALSWVQRNIAAFGGDPARVTLAGQSAGALSALDLFCAPPAAGLFERAILQSPPLFDLAQQPDVAVGWAEALSSACGGGAGAFDRDALIAQPAQRLVDLHEQLLEQPAFRGTRGGALPTLDPALLPRSPADHAGALPGVDVLIGHTADEGTFFFGGLGRPAPPIERIPGIVAHLCHTDAPESILATERERAAAAGAPADDHSVLARIATDAMIAAPVARWASARAQAIAAAGGSGRVFRYRLDHPGAGPHLRATHTAEVPLLFGSWRDGGPGERLGGQSPGAVAVASELVGAWAAFIDRGDPGWRQVGSGSGDEAGHVFGSAGARSDTAAGA